MNTVAHNTNLYGILTSVELADYLSALDPDDYHATPSSRQAYKDLMAAAWHATAGTALDTWLGWSTRSSYFAVRVKEIRKAWNSLRPDAQLTARHLAREAMLVGDDRLQKRLAMYAPGAVPQQVMALLNGIKEPADAARAVEKLTELEELHPYQINALLNRIATKAGFSLAQVREDYQLALAARHRRTPIDWPDYTIQKTGAVRLPATLPNFRHLLQRAHIRVHYNRMTHGIELAYERDGREHWTGNKAEMVAEIFSHATRNDITISETTINLYLNRLAQDERVHYHPVMLWLKDGLWDGTDHLGRLVAALRQPSWCKSEQTKANLKTWLKTALRAAGTDEGISGAPILMLAGEPGLPRARFLDWLLPRERRLAWVREGLPWPLHNRLRRDEPSTWQYVSRWITVLTQSRWRDLAGLSNREFFDRPQDYVKGEDRPRRTVFILPVAYQNEVRKFPYPDWLLPIQARDIPEPPPDWDARQLWLQAREEP